jgi:hypothetical protein
MEAGWPPSLVMALCVGSITSDGVRDSGRCIRVSVGKRGLRTPQLCVCP